jgi:hypothetical protein
MNIFAMQGKSGTSYSGKAGYAVVIDGDGSPVLCTAATDLPAGVIASVIDSDNQVAIALPGALIPVKVSGTVKRMQRGVVQADATAKAATGTAAEVEYCQFLQDGVADEIVNAIILAPIKRA